MNESLRHYQVAVQHPGVSGFEVLDMLMLRDRLQRQVPSLSANEQRELAIADRDLLAQAGAFHEELAQVTSLDYERRQRQPLPSHWWWYLDVLLLAPLTATGSVHPLPTAA